MSEAQPVHVIGRYALYDEIASGGMATVHLGRLLGPVGFARTVAIKRLHQHYAKSSEFVAMFLDEARLAARIRHPNVVPTLDVVALSDELFLVMEYVHGVSLSRLAQLTTEEGLQMPVEVAATVIVGALQGLHAAHEAFDERGLPLGIVHRDISPHNVMVGSDGLPRVLDFGVAKASWRVQTTRSGHVKGKLSYMAPEQVNGGEVGPWTDVYATGIVLWEALTSERLFKPSDTAAIWSRFTNDETVAPPSAYNDRVSPELDAVVMRALENDSSRRFASAREMADALEACVHLASNSAVARWLQSVVREELDLHSALIAGIEKASTNGAGASGEELPSLRRALASFAAGAAAREPSTRTAATQLLPAEQASRSQLIAMTRSPSPNETANPRPNRLARLALSTALIAAAVALPLALTHAASRHEFGATKAGAMQRATAGAKLESPASSPVLPTPTPTPTPTVEAEDLPIAPRAAHVGMHLAHPVGKSAAAARAAADATPPIATTEPGMDCRPPYIVDSRGVRHMKLACIR